MHLEPRSITYLAWSYGKADRADLTLRPLAAHRDHGPAGAAAHQQPLRHR
ncbi:MAG: hypothetical protein IPG68_13330 [Micrococcales bacterium]|nr:hypothetical protein [Micrococcales bacterium]